MPDIDGLKILKVIKNQYPDLPVLVITGFGDEGTKLTALSQYNTGYLDKPFEIADLVTALKELSPGATTVKGREEPSEPADEEMHEAFSAYVTIRIDNAERSMAIFDELYNLEGVQSCEAVRGDVDIILLAQASSQEGIKVLTDRVRAIEGLSVVSAAAVERPKLDRDVDEFIKIYQQVVKRTAQTSPGKHPGTTAISS